MRTPRIISPAAIGVTIVTVLMGCTIRADAETIDGKGKLLCAPTTVLACSAERQCASSTPGAANLPNFIRVDFKKKHFSGADIQGPTNKTAIENVTVKDGKVVVQGADGPRTWSLVIDQHSGGMTGAVVDSNATFVIYGECMVP